LQRTTAFVACAALSRLALGCGSDKSSNTTAAAVATTAAAAATTAAGAATTAAGAATTVAGAATTAAGAATTAASTTPVSLDLPAKIKIGAPLDTSGSAAVATVGTDEKNGEQLAIDEINATGFLGSTKLSLDFVDTQAAKDVATQTVIAMTTTDKVDAIVGFSLSASFLAAGPLAQDAKIPTIAVGLSGTGITEVGDYVFRVYPALVNLYDKTDPEIIQALGAKTAAYFYSSDSANVVEQSQHRQKSLEALGIKTVASEGVASDAIDYQPQLTSIKAANPDVLIVNINGGQDATFVTQYQQAGLTTQLMTDLAWGAPAIVANPVTQCAIFTTTWDISNTTGKNPAFIKAYQDKYGKPASPYSAWGYDGIYLYATAVKNAGSADGAKVRDALAGLKDFEGALGTYGFDANRSPTQTGVVLQIDGGKTVPWTAQSTCKK
ncbi:MAG: amino acid/amide transporter substrate-binding protein family, partial [Ilumatobacteraceae bacterium]|nr:amino acid/amide transporter substrate-binding protein family [Ilumatobacteraceae bacterium]